MSGAACSLGDGRLFLDDIGGLIGVSVTRITAPVEEHGWAAADEQQDNNGADQ